jgi:uncharacterized cupredoxin-like copper-binding protein
MKKLLTLTALALLISGNAYAAGTHAGGHDQMKIGVPGEASEASRTIEVIMKETDDGDMIFEPDSIKVNKFETVRFLVKNIGELEHEFVMDEHENILKHKDAMAKMPEMEHEDPNAVRLIEGTDGEIIWTFTTAGTFEFACLIPGHYESGMKGTIQVAVK